MLGYDAVFLAVARKLCDLYQHLNYTKKSLQISEKKVTTRILDTMYYTYVPPKFYRGNRWGILHNDIRSENILMPLRWLHNPDSHRWCYVGTG